LSLSHQEGPRTGQDRRDGAGRSEAVQGGASPMRATPTPRPSFPHRRADPQP